MGDEPTASTAVKADSTAPKVVYDHDDDDREEDEGAKKPKSRKLVFAGATFIVVAVGLASLIFLGNANSGHFYFTCKADKIIAEQGRSFPPWGAKELKTPEYKAIEIPPEAECKSTSTDEEVELQGWMKDALYAQATKLLTARQVTKVDLAEAQLNQALLLARSNSGSIKRDQIASLLGDVGYWRASAKLAEASTALAEVVKQFDDAAAKQPQYAKDAKAYANYLRQIVDELKLGPKGATPPTPTVSLPSEPTTKRDPAPMGSALPVELPLGGPGSAASAPPIDAGVTPTGGVLL